MADLVPGTAWGFGNDLAMTAALAAASDDPERNEIEAAPWDVAEPRHINWFGGFLVLLLVGVAIWCGALTFQKHRKEIAAREAKAREPEIAHMAAHTSDGLLTVGDALTITGAATITGDVLSGGVYMSCVGGTGSTTPTQIFTVD